MILKRGGFLFAIAMATIGCGAAPNADGGTSESAAEEGLSVGQVTVVSVTATTLYTANGPFPIHLCARVTVEGSYGGWSYVFYHGEQNYHPAAYGWVVTNSIGGGSCGPSTQG